MKLNITCKVGVYSNPIKITFNNQSKILTDNNSGLSFDFDADTEYELTIEQIHKDKESVPTRVTNIVLNVISHYISASAKMEKLFDYVNYGGVRPYLLCLMQDNISFSKKEFGIIVELFFLTQFELFILILLILPLILGHCYPIHHHYLYHKLSWLHQLNLLIPVKNSYMS